MKPIKSTKASKPSASSREEECGKWLDAAELKEKKQKRLTRPISKFLNPLARSGGYSVAVALSFTQTKLNMPVTKQSTISSFFSPKPRDPEPSAAHAEMYTSMKTHTGVKRKRAMTLVPSLEADISTSQTSEVWEQNCEEESAEDSDELKNEKHFLHLMCSYEPEEEPLEKRRLIVDHTDQNVSETQEYWNKDAFPRRIHDEIQRIPETETFFHGDLSMQESQGHDLLMVRKPLEEVCGDSPQFPSPKKHGFKDKLVSRDQNSAVRGSVFTSRPVNENHKRTATSRVINKASPMKLKGKENIEPISPSNTARSPFKQLLTPSPVKSRLRKKYTLSPRKSDNENRGTEMAGDTLAMLFTQDSEGFPVIAHRDHHLRNPLKDHTNLSVDKDYRNSSSDGSLEKEEEEEESDLESQMLFTQDSEGNMVIKH